MATRPVLGILDRAFRGAVEAQFFDALYGFLDLRRDMGEVHVILRGSAVSMAVAEQDFRPVLHLGGVPIDTLPDYRGLIGELVSEGITVMIDEPDLRMLGFRPEQLVEGVHSVDSNEIAAKWPSYAHVWFV